VRLDDFAFDLPEELIAQQPTAKREASRLLVLDRAAGTINHRSFAAIGEWFRPGDLLIANDTRVIPARLLGRKESGGQIEVFLVRREVGDEKVWRCLTRSSKPPRAGSRVIFADGSQAVFLGGGEPPLQRVRFESAGDFSAWLEANGEMPLPPYIRRAAGTLDRERYQTVFARHAGALAAPTAGLHFTPEILADLTARGVEVQALTLHVGLGTFLPVRVADPREHRMHHESYLVPEATAAAVNRARAEGRRIVALGTTSTRALEAAADADGRVAAGPGETDIFIYPGYRFRAVSGLVTNFHLPRSTLLMLVAAFAGQEAVLEAYRQAVTARYRFFSYGDCMLIL
jgi:S-adenosylmethionine:tRNA ribosyltransferase-isomerase